MPRSTRFLLIHLAAALMLLLPAAMQVSVARAFDLTVHFSIVTQAMNGIMAPKNIDTVRTANLSGDAHQFAPEQHFDDAPDPATLCTRWNDGLDAFLKSTVKFSAPEGNALTTLKDSKQALEAFGRATHALEDFYSHTNWLELGMLVHGMPALAPLAGETCDLSAYPHLQSGYFNLIYGYTGCPKGGPPAPYRYCHLQLNKDSSGSQEGRVIVSGTSLHDIAVDRATEATTKLWLDAVHDRIQKMYTRKDYYADPECIFKKLAWSDKKSCVDLNGTWTLKAASGAQANVKLEQSGSTLTAIMSNLSCASGGTRPYFFQLHLTGDTAHGTILLCWDNSQVVGRCNVPQTMNNGMQADLQLKDHAITLTGTYEHRGWSWSQTGPCTEHPIQSVSYTMTRDAP